MRRRIIFILLFVTTWSIYGQVVTFGFGPTYLQDKNKVKIHPKVLGKGAGGNDDWVLKINYKQQIKSQLNLYGSYSQYPVSTYFDFYKENEGGSFGWNGTNVKRFDVGVSYSFFPRSNIIVHPNIGFGIQKSTPDSDGCICSEISGGIKPEYFELSKEIEAYAYSNTQLVPNIGLKLGYAFWGRVELFMDIQQVFGFKKIQELRMDYTYKGVQQPQADSYSDGTGRFYSLGMGYRFVKQKRN